MFCFTFIIFSSLKIEGDWVGEAKLNITFHNPNTVEEVARELVKISAELAKTQINNFLLHNEAKANVQIEVAANKFNIVENQGKQA